MTLLDFARGPALLVGRARDRVDETCVGKLPGRSGELSQLLVTRLLQASLSGSPATCSPSFSLAREAAQDSCVIDPAAVRSCSQSTPSPCSLQVCSTSSAQLPSSGLAAGAGVGAASATGAAAPASAAATGSAPAASAVVGGAPPASCCFTASRGASRS